MDVHADKTLEKENTDNKKCASDYNTHTYTGIKPAHRFIETSRLIFLSGLRGIEVGFLVKLFPLFYFFPAYLFPTQKKHGCTFLVFIVNPPFPILSLPLQPSF